MALPPQRRLGKKSGSGGSGAIPHPIYLHFSSAVLVTLCILVLKQGDWEWRLILRAAPFFNYSALIFLMIMGLSFLGRYI